VCQLDLADAVAEIALLDNVTGFYYSDTPVVVNRGLLSCLTAISPSRTDLLMVTFDHAVRFGVAAKVFIPKGSLLGEFSGVIRHREWYGRGSGRDIRVMEVRDRDCKPAAGHSETRIHHVLDMRPATNWTSLINHSAANATVCSVWLDAKHTRMGVETLVDLWPGRDLTLDYGRACESALRVWEG
jgi:hypothetical protein